MLTSETNQYILVGRIPKLGYVRHKSDVTSGANMKAD